MITPTDANYHTIADAVYDIVLDNLIELERILKSRGKVLSKGKADRLIRELNKCLGGQSDEQG